MTRQQVYGPGKPTLMELHEVALLVFNRGKGYIGTDLEVILLIIMLLEISGNMTQPQVSHLTRNQVLVCHNLLKQRIMKKVFKLLYQLFLLPV